MRHLILIDPLGKLNIKKDSSLMLALSLQRRGIETYVFFEKDFAVHNQGIQKLNVYKFSGSFKEDSIYLESFDLSTSEVIELGSQDLVHMRLDPPFDSRYLRVLWMLDELCEKGVRVLNHPRGIMLFNEKLYAYRSEGAIPSFIGSNVKLAEDFLTQLEKPLTDVVLKPLDLFSGIGVEKLSISSWRDRFSEKVKELGGPVILQPFQSAVAKGEIRSLYFGGQELGTILKIPKTGEFLSNIAQGASFKKFELSDIARQRCEKIVRELEAFGVHWVAFDILGDSICEVNITCPGLLVEVSFAYQRNLADELIDLINQKF